MRSRQMHGLLRVHGGGASRDEDQREHGGAAPGGNFSLACLLWGRRSGGPQGCGRYALMLISGVGNLRYGTTSTAARYERCAVSGEDRREIPEEGSQRTSSPN